MKLSGAKKILYSVGILVIICLVFVVYYNARRYINENKILKEVVSRLEADSRIAEVLVTGVNYDEPKDKMYTTIKFLEYDVDGKPLESKYFTFAGNIIQFQSLVIRFDDIHIRKADSLKGKSAYLFWKVFMLDGSNTQEHELTRMNKVPDGYKIEGVNNSFEQKLWQKFWQYALNPKESANLGVKNAQIEAPGTMFVPGYIYTINIEHDGGIRIDASAIPHILKGESIPRP